MHFMAVEVAAQEYLFIPKPTWENEPTDIHQVVSAQLQEQEAAKAKVPFSHNHLHDLESLWWVTAWVVFCYLFSEGTTSRDCLTLEDADHQLKVAEELFPPVANNTTRSYNFTLDRSFREMREEFPKNKRHAHAYLDYLRGELIDHYGDVESKYPIIEPNASENDIYDTFKESFKALKSIYHDVTLKSILDIRAELSKPENKRPRSESTKDSGVAQKNARV